MSARIPSTQRAWVLPEVGQPLRFVNNHPVPSPSSLKPNECLVKLTYSGVCRSDLYILQGHFSPPKKDLIGGHEGIGEVVAFGNGAVNSKVRLGQRVGIKYVGDACLNCDQCLSGHDCYCPHAKKSGSSIDGTFCEYAVSYTDYVTPIPDNLASEDAAALMCGGLAAFATVKRSQIRAGEWVVVVGACGGLGHYTVQFAKLAGARVIAIDNLGEAERLRLATIELGADKCIDIKATRDPVDIVKEVTNGGAHVVIVAAGSPDAYKDAIFFLRPRGRLMAVGLPPKTMLNVPVLLVAGKGLSIQGNFVGTRQDAIEALDLAAAGRIKSRCSVRDLSELESVYAELEQNKTIGKVVLKIS